MWHDSTLHAEPSCIPLKTAWMHSCRWHDAFTREPWRIHKCDKIYSYMWHDTFLCVTPLICIVCDVTHSHVWHGSFKYVAWRIRVRDMSLWYTWHDSFIHVTWLIHARDMTLSRVWYDTFIRKLHDIAHLFLCVFKNCVQQTISFIKSWPAWPWKNKMLFVHLNLKQTWH